MSTLTLPVTGEEAKAQQAKDDANAPEPKQLDALHTELGDTTIADTVVEKVAGIATREVSGVYAMGNAAGRAVSALTQRVGGKSSVSSGVKIEKGERQAAIEVGIVVDYGVSIVDVSGQIRTSVINAVEFATGLEVVSVDVDVTDVHLPEDDSADTATSTTDLA